MARPSAARRWWSRKRFRPLIPRVDIWALDVEATTAVVQAEVGAAKTMIDRTIDQLDVRPSRLAADAGYGSAEMLGWLVDERGIEPHVRVFDKSQRTGGTFSRSDFAYDPEGDLYVCPGEKEL
jgi:hypothetical protein